MNILLICPSFHGYNKEIIKELQKEGHAVYFSTTSISLSLFERVKKKISTCSFQKKYLKFLSAEIDKYKCINFDRVVVVYGGEGFSTDCFYALKLAFKNAKFIYFNWDSVAHNKESLKYYKLFDKRFSFDLCDCEKYGYERLDNWFTFDNPINSKPEYDFGTLMVLCKPKVEGYLKIKAALPGGLKGKEYLFVPNRYVKLQEIFLDRRRFKKIDKGSLKYKPLPLEESTGFYNNCRAVIDVPLEGQNGLTTRTFEVLRQEKKLITTNKTIKLYEFYSPNNIYIVDEQHTDIPKSFFETPFDKTYSISDNYSLKSFVHKLFNL